MTYDIDKNAMKFCFQIKYELLLNLQEVISNGPILLI